MDFEAFKRLLKWRAANDFDNVLAITGDEGDGKSTLGARIAKAVDPSFHLGRNTIFDFEDWRMEWNRNGPGHAYLLDEGGNLAFNRDWSNSENKMLQHILRESRQFNHTIIFCIPVLAWLDKNLREHRVRWWIQVQTLNNERGHSNVAERKRRAFPSEEVYFENLEQDYRFGSIDDWPDWQDYKAKKASIAQRRHAEWNANNEYERERFNYRRARQEERLQKMRKPRRKRLPSLEPSSSPPTPPQLG